MEFEEYVRRQLLGLDLDDETEDPGRGAKRRRGIEPIYADTHGEPNCSLGGGHITLNGFHITVYEPGTPWFEIYTVYRRREKSGRIFSSGSWTFLPR